MVEFEVALLGAVMAENRRCGMGVHGRKGGSAAVMNRCELVVQAGCRRCRWSTDSLHSCPIFKWIGIPGMYFGESCPECDEGCVQVSAAVVSSGIVGVSF